MRLLFTTIPGASHMLPLVPLAHAALAAGHEVLVAASGSALRVAVGAGLPAIAIDDGEAGQTYEKLAHMVAERSTGARITDAEHIDYIASVFGRMGEIMLDRLVDAARTWGAEAVVYPPPHVAGLVAARAVGVPAVLHGIGTPRPTFRPALVHLLKAVDRAGVVAPGEADVEVDLSPASLPRFTQDAPVRPAGVPTVRMRYTPYNGGAELTRGLLTRGARPRVVVTLGSIPGIYGDGDVLREVVQGTADLGVELVLATGDASLAALPTPLPPHVTAVGWVPLRQLLATGDLVIHHGGMGTMYTAFDAGVPQVVLTLPDDSLPNARTACERGAGAMLPMSGTTADDLAPVVADVLRDPSYRAASREVAVEMRAMPSPATALGRLLAVIGPDRP
ncbi:nucleotide disphospho-sugar-binding domain-containing protein [Saccharothrix syringae]|uniref:DUF1205 domain-containing protein n=1 Tax=Saccharothrix syringae TaxID=103733 RepID=A0A5Q0H5F4_SACSY|nr:nucleotide disphospho-sugar-binding domain-containing protein [Saccharothrix syringae]QFZ21437.1 DUF1205 domain-containing protein [Saccharothrix syringae]